MAVSNGEPRSPFDRLQGLLDQMWAENARLRTRFARTAAPRQPAARPLELDVADEDGVYVVTASVPGFKRDEVAVEVHENGLVIRAQHAGETAGASGRYLYRERHSGAFMRRIALPGVGPDSKVDASIEDGVLQVVISARREG